VLCVLSVSCLASYDALVLQHRGVLHGAVLTLLIQVNEEGTDTHHDHIYRGQDKSENGSQLALESLPGSLALRCACGVCGSVQCEQTLTNHGADVFNMLLIEHNISSCSGSYSCWQYRAAKPSNSKFARLATHRGHELGTSK
jgi:hypothetical protein